MKLLSIFIPLFACITLAYPPSLNAMDKTKKSDTPGARIMPITDPKERDQEMKKLIECVLCGLIHSAIPQKHLSAGTLDT